MSHQSDYKSKGDTEKDAIFHPPFIFMETVLKLLIRAIFVISDLMLK